MWAGLLWSVDAIAAVSGEQLTWRDAVLTFERWLVACLVGMALVAGGRRWRWLRRLLCSADRRRNETKRHVVERESL
jgi:hypothetical protein